MNKSITKVEQALHGYSRGHHLLAASIELSKSSQRMMSILSDLSGPEVYDGFSEYISGYPLIEDGYYALAKTWYAPEMKRPGCVWTHTLLIKFDDLKEIQDNSVFLKHFNKPTIKYNNDNYCHSIELFYELNHNSLTNYDNITSNKLRYLTWSIYSEDKPVILPSDSSSEYEKLVLLIWQNLWLKLRCNFTFSTGSLANRKLGKQTFDIQITPHSLSKSISRSDQASVILDGSQMDASLLRYPKWVSRVTDEFLHEPNGPLKDFLEDFGATFENRAYFSKLAQLYIEADDKNRFREIGNYFTAVQAIFNKNDGELITKTFLESIFNSFPNRWLAYNDVSLLLQDLSSIKGADKIPYSEPEVKHLLELLWKSENSKVKELLKELIYKDINQFGQSLLKKYSQIVEPKKLGLLTEMDLGVCNVLVSLNPKLAMCPEIWHQSKDFQCEIIDCIDHSVLNSILTREIVESILDNSTELLCEQVFKVFGNISVSIFLKWCRQRTEQYDRKVRDWIKLCKYSPETSIEWLASCENLDIRLLALIISVIDPYSKTVNKYGLKPWFKLFQQLPKQISPKIKLTLAQFFLPLSLMRDEAIAKDFAIFSFYPVHKALEQNQFNYEQWKKLERLLPALSWYQSWDKCKRLRLAMKNKGYCTSVKLDFNGKLKQ